MIKKLFNQFRSPIIFDKLKIISAAAIKNVMEGKDKSVSYLKVGIQKFCEAQPTFLEEWEKYLDDRLKNVANVSNIANQIIVLREQTLYALEKSINAKLFIERNAEERAILSPILKVEGVEETVEFTQTTVYISNEAFCYCFRSISYFLGDVGQNDWFDIYNNLYSTYINLGYNVIIANMNKKDFPLGLLYEPFQSNVENYRSRVLKGEKLFLTDSEMELLMKANAGPEIDDE